MIIYLALHKKMRIAYSILIWFLTYLLIYYQPKKELIITVAVHTVVSQVPQRTQLQSDGILRRQWFLFQ